MKLKYLIVFIISLNTWALSDRALFTIKDKVYFISEVNQIITKFEKSICYMGRDSLVTEIYQILSEQSDRSKLSFSQIKIHNSRMSSEEIKYIEAIAGLIKLFTVSKTSSVVKTDNAKLKACGLAKDTFLPVVLKTEIYLRDKVISSKQSKEQITNTLKLFKTSFIDKIDYRAFY